MQCNQCCQSHLKIIWHLVSKRISSSCVKSEHHPLLQSNFPVRKPNRAAEMPFLTDFCCGCSLKTGSVIIGVFYIVWSLVSISSAMRVLYTHRYVRGDLKWGESGSVTKKQLTARLVFAVIQAVWGLFLLVGAIQKMADILRAWALVEAVLVLALTIMYITISASLMSNNESGGFVALVFATIYALLSVYFLVVVYSYYQTLRHDMDSGGAQP